MIVLFVKEVVHALCTCEHAADRRDHNCNEGSISKGFLNNMCKAVLAGRCTCESVFLMDSFLGKTKKDKIEDY